MTTDQWTVGREQWAGMRVPAKGCGDEGRRLVRVLLGREQERRFGPVGVVAVPAVAAFGHHEGDLLAVL